MCLNNWGWTHSQAIFSPQCVEMGNVTFFSEIKKFPFWESHFAFQRDPRTLASTYIYWPGSDFYDKFSSYITNYSDKKSMVLTQKETCGSVGQNRWHKNNPSTSSQLIFDKKAKNTHWMKDHHFIKWCGENWLHTCRRFSLHPYFSLCTKMK